MTPLIKRDRLCAVETWINDLYNVEIRPPLPASSPFIHLTIRRVDGAAIHSWSDLQAIKNQIIGRQCEAVELYPAEERLVDAANQYHLFCATDPSYRFPFGYAARFVAN